MTDYGPRSLGVLAGFASPALLASHFLERRVPVAPYPAPAVTSVRYPVLDAPLPSDLAARVAAGDRDAFVALYRTHFAEVRAFAERVLGSRAAAEDVVHDVFLALPGALRSFRGECTLKSFVLSVAVRSARTHYRSAVRRRKHEERAHAETFEELTQGPDAGAERRELASLLSRALDTLPVDQRVAFVLCEVEERTSAEVAEILGENASTIRGRLFHAKKKLRVELAASSPRSGDAP